MPLGLPDGPSAVALAVQIRQLANKVVDKALNPALELIAGAVEILSLPDLDRAFDRQTEITRENYQTFLKDEFQAPQPTRAWIITALLMLASAYREYFIRTGLRIGANAIRELVRFAHPSNPLFVDDEEREMAEFVVDGIGRDVALRLVSRAGSMTQKMEELQLQFEARLADKAAQVDALEKRLDKAKFTYNFVFLVQAFSDLHRRKTIERRVALAALWIFGILVTVPLLMQLPIAEEIGGDKLFHIELDTTNWMKGLPLLALEVVLLYFFRVALNNFHSVKAELLQIDLKRSLCQFIETYLDFSASKFKDKESAQLSRFEAVIFSGISSSPERIPLTFDPLDSLANVAKAIKAK